MISPRRHVGTVLLAGLMTTAFVLHSSAAEPVDVVFKSKLDGTDQRYVVVLPDEFDAEKQPHSVLIALHGHGSDRWQFVKDGRGECKAAREAKTSWMGPAVEADVVQTSIGSSRPPVQNS